MAMTTREAWLFSAMEAMWPLVEKFGKIPDTCHVLCSWPPTSIRRCIGMCHHPAWTPDQSIYITISPMLIEPREVLRTLLHEMVHAVGNKGHGRRFKAVCATIGLLNEDPHVPMDDTTLRADLISVLDKLSTTLGPYPHTPMTPPEKKSSSTTKKKSKIKCISKADPEYWIEIKAALIDTVGTPLDPRDSIPMEIAVEDKEPVEEEEAHEPE
jgi:hypothetical protein